MYHAQSLVQVVLQYTQSSWLVFRDHVLIFCNIQEDLSEWKVHSHTKFNGQQHKMNKQNMSYKTQTLYSATSHTNSPNRLELEVWYREVKASYL